MPVDDHKLGVGGGGNSQVREYIADRNNRIRSKLNQTNNALLIDRIAAYGKWTAIGLLALGVCSLLILFGISLLIEPKILRTEKVVVKEIPKIVETEKVVVQREPVNVYVQGNELVRSEVVRPSVSLADIKDRLPANYRMGKFNISLTWNTVDDLDVHVKEPNGREIYHLKKQSPSGGKLTKDLNADALTPTPVENIKWSNREPPNGLFVIEVVGYRQNKKPATEVPFTVTVTKSGRVIREKQGKIKWSGSGSRPRVRVMEFQSNP
jgi:hypothetical protein